MVQTEELLVVTRVEGVEGAGEGVNPRGPPAIAPDAPGAAPALLSTSETRRITFTFIKTVAKGWKHIFKEIKITNTSKTTFTRRLNSELNRNSNSKIPTTIISVSAKQTRYSRYFCAYITSGKYIRSRRDTFHRTFGGRGSARPGSLLLAAHRENL